jgi:hypothetical protein
MIKYAKIYQNSIKNIENNSLRKKFLGQKLKILAHICGWIVLKIIFWPIFKTYWFLGDNSLFMANLIEES